MARTQIEVKVAGMDCAECTEHVQRALAALPGVEDVRVLLSSEKAVLQVDPTQVDLPTIRRAVEGAGYTVPDVPPGGEEATSSRSLISFTRPILTLFGLVFGAVLLCHQGVTEPSHTVWIPVCRRGKRPVGVRDGL